MKPLTIMIVAGDPSGDLAAAELINELRRQSAPVPPRFLGAGGPAMAAAGVNLRFELTRHSVIGVEILRRILWFRHVLQDLTQWAMSEVPDVVIGVDYAGFNLRLAAALRRGADRRRGPFSNWRPRLVQFVSPQVWASRPGRARRMERTHDLLLSILPFEADWYARRAPRLPVRFVGHPIVDRHAHSPAPFDVEPESGSGSTLVLLPGSRPGELQRHLPVMVPAAREAAKVSGCRIRMVLPREDLRPLALSWCNDPGELGIQVGGLDEVLRSATVALASTGTVTMECAWYGVPTVALYKTSRLTFAIGRRIVTVPHLAMPNLLAGSAIVPEFIQFQATSPALAGAVLDLLGNRRLRNEMRARLRTVARSLGPPGTASRAARSILELASAPAGPDGKSPFATSGN
ncbi:MAG: lipid-A-disaccharide synthase [Verrucomicrobiales bacterium]|nr:lipid-A-disaccharide synthase [Verrucomicrobiales bacterium]